MYIICYGAHKTGSTICFQIVSALLEANGFNQNVIPQKSISPNRAQNFRSAEASNDPEWIATLEEGARDPQLFAIKFHGKLTQELKRLLDEGKILSVVNTRDPRDTFLSLIDAGKKNKVGGFSRLDSESKVFDKLLVGALNTEAWLQARALVADYHEVAFEPVKFIRSLELYLKFEPQDESIVKDIVNKADSSSNTKNLAIPHRFMHDMTLYQAMYYTQRFSDKLSFLSERFSSLGKNANAYYPHRDLITRNGQSEIVTDRTYVVIGCPRGGTSLIAGALYHAGVDMGDFKTAQYEDPDFKVPLKEIKGPSNKWLSRVTEVISVRNSEKRVWGWKVPNSIYYIEKIRHLLINPVFIFVYRDPLEVAKSSAKHDKRNWFFNKRRLLRIAHSHYDLVRKFESSLPREAERYSFNVTDIKSDPVCFVNEIRNILRKGDLEESAILKFINRNGGYVEPIK